MSESGIPTVPTAALERGEITGRDLSYHEAMAGIAAREAAAGSGGEPAQLRTLVAAAQAQDVPAAPAAGPLSLKGVALRGDDLLVTMCFMLHEKVFGADPRHQLAHSVEDQGLLRMQAIAALALIFTQPDTAYDLLDRAADPELAKEESAGWSRDFRRRAVEFAGDFQSLEIITLTKHVVDLARRQGAGEEEPGK